jgi:predicted metal-dependent hydrolase
MFAIDTHFWKGVALFNRGEFFEAHEEMEEAMNLLEDDTSDWNFYRGMLRASVANHKLGQNEIASAQLHLRAALGFLEPYPNRHRGIRLGDFRSALTAQLSQLDSAATDLKPLRIELAR